MFSQSLKLEVRGANDRIYTLLLQGDSPLGEINDALSTMKSVVLKQMQEQHERELNAFNPPLGECCEATEECKEPEAE